MKNPIIGRGAVAVLICLFLYIPNGYAEFFRYRDEQGHLYYVDEIWKIPEQYRDQAGVYKEKYDHLDPEARRKKLAEEREKRAAQSKADSSEPRNLARFETPVTIRGNSVLVPVTLGYRGRSAKTLMVLDTGAYTTTLHKEVADRLVVWKVKPSAAYGADGSRIPTAEARFDYIQVGPIRKDSLNVSVYKHNGPSVPYKGLLGMNFLRGLNYRVDFDRGVIVWNP